MAKKRTVRYDVHPHVITGPPRPVVERVRITPDEFGARYYPLSAVTAPAGSAAVVTLSDGEMRYIIELPSVLVRNGMSSEP